MTKGAAAGRALTPREVLGGPVGSVQVVAGRVTAVRDLGGMTFLDLAWEGVTVQLVAHRQSALRRLDLIEVECDLAETADGARELRLRRVVSHIPAVDRGRDGALRLFEPGRVPALKLRGAVELSVRESLNQRGFLPVRSAGIVGNWVEGQTGAFGLDFYGKSAYLTISNMLCHQILLGSGLGNLYEIGPIYRAETPRSRRRLAEFTMVDVGMAFADLDAILEVMEAVMCGVYAAVRGDIHEEDRIDVATPFPRVPYAEVLREAGLSRTGGAQLPAAARAFLARRYPGFVWVTGFPVRTRPFFVRAEDGVCVDAQLWFGGQIYLAAGGERETSWAEMTRRIQAEGKEPGRYAFFLDYLRAALPRSAGMGFGLERLLAALVGGTAADYAAFPEPAGTLRSGDQPEKWQ